MRGNDTKMNVLPKAMFHLSTSPSSSDYRQASPFSNSNVYIAKLPVHIDEATLTKLFERYGTIECCRVQRNPQNTTGRTFGFVKFHTRQEARGAIEGMNGALINGTPIEVKLADQDPGEKASSGTPSDNLYVRNLPSTWGTEEMTSLFSHYGTVMTCRVLHSGERQGRGAGGLVRMSTVTEASQAIAGLNGRIPQGGSDMLFVRYADTPDEKAKRKAKKSELHPHHPSYPCYHPYAKPPPQAHQIAQQQQPVYAVDRGVPYPATGWTLDPGAAAAAAAAVAYTVTPSPAACPAVYASRPVTYTSPQSCSIYIKNLPPTADKLFLYEKFARFGGITSVKPMPDEATGTCKGIGFVNYTDVSAAQMAVDHMHGALLGDKVLHVSLQSIKFGVKR